MRRPGEIVRHDPTALIRVRESHNRFAEQLPSLLEANVLLDYNPAVDLGSPGFAYGGSGAITLGNRRGLPCAEYDGVSALYGPALFENLSDLTGGVSIYLMIEQDIKYAASGAASVFGMRRQAAATQRDCLGVYQVHVGTALVGLVGDSAAASTPITYMSKKGVVFHSMHVTTAEVRIRNLHSDGNISAAPTAPHDPSGMDQSVIGAAAVFGAVNGWLTGAIYRIVVVEGAYDAALDAELQALYTPIPGLMFDFDPVRSLTEEVFDRVALTDPIGGVSLAASSTGAEGASFDGTNYLTSLPPFETLAELNGGLTVYTVFEHTAAGATAGYGGLWSVDRTAGLTFADRLSASRYDTNEQVYNYAHNAAVTQAYHTFAAKVPLGVVCFHAAQYSATVRYAGLGGALTNSADFTSILPVGMDRLVIGAANSGTAVSYLVEGVTMRVLFCEGPYKQTVMDALISKYAPVRIPPGVRGADVISLFDPRQFHRSPELAQDYAEFGSGADQIAFGGMPCLKSLGVNSGMDTPFNLFNKLSEFTGAALTVYAAIATPGAQTSGYVSASGVIHNSGPDLRYGCLSTSIRDIAGGGNSSSIWESAAPVVSVAEGSGHSGHPRGEIGMVATEYTLTTIEGYYNGASNGPTAHAVDAGAYSEPTYHLVRVLFGGLQLVGDAHNLLYCVIVLGEYDAAVDAWVQATFLQGTVPVLLANTSAIIADMNPAVWANVSGNLYLDSQVDEDWSSNAVPTLTGTGDAARLDFVAASLTSAFKYTDFDFVSYTTEVPFTVYTVYTPQGTDFSSQNCIWSFRDPLNAGTHRAYLQMITGGEFRCGLQETSYSSLTTSGLGAVVGTQYVIAIEFHSTTSASVWVDGVETGPGGFVARDPGALTEFFVGLLVSSGLYADGELARCMLVKAAYDADLNGALTAKYS